MKWFGWLWALVVACTGGGENTYIVEGVVIEVKSEEVIIDHEDIDGLMPAMVMGFPVEDPSMLEHIKPGQRVIARYVLEGPKSRLNKIRVTGQGPIPKLETSPLRPGEPWPDVTVPVHDGTSVRLGAGQTDRVLLTFIYTRCPLPEACPAIVSRFAALQDQLAADDAVTLLAISLDPAYDSLDVLKRYAEDVGVGPKWKLGRVESDVLADFAKRSGMNVMPDGDQIAHGLRILALDAGGKLIERYDSPRFDGDRVLTQLKTGKSPEPAANPTPPAEPE
ncbi:MAG: SCO family protein [Myxococcota bacterium]